jgi:ABC-type transporter Mla subunit MlaD
MNEPSNHWKLGLFVVVGGTLIMTAFVYLGSRSLNKESVSYVSYFDESVTGLEVGSPVRFRGVTVGKVSKIDVAPDRRNVEISYELVVSVIGELGLAADKGEHTKMKVPPGLLAQIGSSGLTGVKYVLIDYFDSEDHPAATLTFPLPERYIPSTPSTMKNLEESVVRAIDKFPAIAEDMQKITNQVNDLLVAVAGQHIPERVASSLDDLDRTLAVVRQKLEGVDTHGLSSDARATLSTLSATMTRAQVTMERLDGERGVFVSVQRASDAIGDVAGEARGYRPELSDALRDFREAADAFRQLTQTLEIDSDMLIKGRAQVRE